MMELTGLNLTAPSGCIIGIIPLGTTNIAATGATIAGATIIDASGKLPEINLNEAPGNYILDHTFARTDSAAKSLAVATLLRLRRQGATFLLISQDERLLESCADEIWWLDDNKLIARGDPAEVLAQYRRHVAETLRQSGEGQLIPLSPTLRQGDGRARVERVELNSAVIASGEPATLNVAVRFTGHVADPVIGIMIRTRIGLNVYGTNTELEHLKLGPVEADETVTVTFRFDCNLCPGQYTITAASHDPDGVWHDWLEDAIAFAVTDSRYTAGVANLKAVTSVTRSSQTAAR